MKLTNHSVQPFLFRNGTERFKLGGSAIVVEAPDWVGSTKYALDLREQEKVSFEIKKQPKTEKEKLMARAAELGIIHGDGITVAALQAKIAEEEKKLEESKEEKTVKDAKK